MIKLDTQYMGLQLKNPIVVASSGLTNSIEKIKDLEKAGAGAVVLK
jgi:dihydroorotate dehydrogenase (fumarate)